jgi:hypothetical protein
VSVESRETVLRTAQLLRFCKGAAAIPFSAALDV